MNGVAGDRAVTLDDFERDRQCKLRFDHKAQGVLVDAIRSFRDADELRFRERLKPQCSTHDIGVMTKLRYTAFLWQVIRRTVA